MRLPLLIVPLLAWTLQTATGPGPTLDATAVFAPAPLAATRVDGDPAALGAVAAEAARYLSEVSDPVAGADGVLGELGLTVQDRIDTLRLIARVAEEDRGEPHPRLSDPAWLAEQLQLYDWRPPGAETLRITRYYVPQIAGSAARVPGYDTPLYAVPDDEASLDEASAAQATGLLRQRYTRQQVLNGVYQPGGEAAGRAAPLVWLTRADALNALMQGTVEVRQPDGVTRTFNVHRNNGMPYVRGQSSEAQRAYWYFREVQGALGWGADAATKVRLQPGASVAGDVWNLGLGAVIALRWTGPDGPAMRLVVLADSGGAFHGNLGQLDLYGGAFPTASALYAATAAVPQRVRGGVVVRRR